MVDVKVINGELSKAEIDAYITRAKELYPDKNIEGMEISVDGDYVDI